MLKKGSISRFISFKKFHLFSCSLDQSPFLFYFLDSFQVSAAVGGDLVLYNLVLTVRIIFSHKLIRFHILMFRFHGGVGPSVCWVLQRTISYAIRSRQKEHIHAFIALV